MTSVEGAILVWLVIGVGIAGGVFIVARSAVQIASVAYKVIEKEMDARTATRQTTLLSLAIVAALIALGLHRLCERMATRAKFVACVFVAVLLTLHIAMVIGIARAISSGSPARGIGWTLATLTRSTLTPNSSSTACRTCVLCASGWIRNE